MIFGAKKAAFAALTIPSGEDLSDAQPCGYVLSLRFYG